jgi:hypothetical protein
MRIMNDFAAGTNESLSVFGCESKSSRAQVVTIRLDDAIRLDSNRKTSIDLTFDNESVTDPV